MAAAAWHTTDKVDPSMVFMIRAARSGMVKQTCEVCVFNFERHSFCLNGLAFKLDWTNAVIGARPGSNQYAKSIPC